MSGVYIKGMEMPTRCEDCFCFRHNAEYDYAYCNISSVNVLGHGNTRLNNCPLVSVPDHGRLIDADVLNDMINRSYPMTDRVDVHNGYAICQEMIKQLPTIIEAEEVGE